MTLPKEISPNPVVSAAVEVRFNSSLAEDTILGEFLPIFKTKFPKQKDILRLPREIKNANPIAKYQPDYAFINENLSMSFTPNSIAFGNIGGYQTWKDFFPHIQESLHLLKELKGIEDIIRVGVRYGNLFENKGSILEIANLTISQFRGFDINLPLIKMDLKKNNINLHVQAANQAQIEIGEDKKIKIGTYIDIDASSEKNIPNKLGKDLEELIDTLHLEIKTFLFEDFLKKEFLDSFNIKY